MDYEMYEMCAVKIKSVQSLRDLCITLTSNFKFSQQRNEAVKKKTGYWLNKKEFSFNNTDLPTLYNSFIIPHLEYFVQFWTLLN